MKCSVCNTSATYKCCSSRYYCSFHFKPHFNSARGHNPEKMDKVLTPYELDKLKIELVSRIKQLKQAKLEISKKTCELIRKIDNLKNKLIVQLEAYMQRYTNLLDMKETCKSDYIQISNLKQSSLVIPTLNSMSIKELLEKSFSINVSNTENPWKKAKWEKNKFYLTHCAEFTCGLISKDEQFLITGSKDSYLRVWNAESITQDFLYEGHSRSILCLGLSEDSQFAFSGSQDRTLRIWDLKNKKQKALLMHSGQVQSLVFLGQSGIIVSGSLSLGSKAEIYVWDFSELSIVNRFEIAFAELGSFLHLENKPILLLSTGNSIRFLDLNTCLLESREKKHKEKITCVLVTKDNKKVITGCEDANIFIWDINDETSVHQLTSHTESITSLALTKDNFSVLSGSKDKSIRLWCLRLRTQILKLEDYNNYPVTLLSFGENFVILMDDSSFGFADIARKSFRKSLRLRKFKADTEKFIGDNKVSYVADCSSTIWSLNDDAEDSLILSEEVPRFIRISGGQFGLIVFKEDIRYWNVKKNELIAVLKGHDSKALCGCFSSNGMKVALGFKNNAVFIWSLSNIGQVQEMSILGFDKFPKALYNYFKPNRTLEGINIQYSDIHLPHKNSVKAVQFMKYSQFLITGGKDLRIIVWDLNTKSMITVLNGHQSEIIELALTEDNKFILSCGYTKKTQQYEGVKVWSIEKKSLTHKFDSQESAKSFLKENRIIRYPFKKFLL